LSGSALDGWEVIDKDKHSSNDEIDSTEEIDNINKEDMETDGLEIKNEIIDQTFDDLNALLSQFNDDLDNIMNQIVTEIHSVECEVDKTLENFKNLLYSLSLGPLGSIGPKINASDPCRIQFGLGSTNLEQLTPEQLYNLTSCQALNGLTIYTPIKSIWLTYGYMQYICQMMSCMYNESPVLVKFFTQEYLLYTNYASVWEQYLNGGGSQDDTQTELLLRRQFKSLGIAVKTPPRLLSSHGSH